VSGAALVAPSGNRSALEPVVALAFELVEAPGDAALGELVPMSLHAPSAAAAASATVASAIFSKCIGVSTFAPTRRTNPWSRARVPELIPHRSKFRFDARNVEPRRAMEKGFGGGGRRHNSRFSRKRREPEFPPAGETTPCRIEAAGHSQ
jgi:hypothetical protein